MRTTTIVAVALALAMPLAMAGPTKAWSQDATAEGYLAGEVVIYSAGVSIGTLAFVGTHEASAHYKMVCQPPYGTSWGTSGDRNGSAPIFPRKDIQFDGPGYVVIRVDPESSPWHYEVDARWRGPSSFAEGVMIVNSHAGGSEFDFASYRYRHGSSNEEQVSIGVLGSEHRHTISGVPAAGVPQEGSPSMVGRVDPPSNGSHTFVGFWYAGTVDAVHWHFWGEDLRGDLHFANGSTEPIVPIQGDIHVSSAAGAVDASTSPACVDGPALVAGLDTRERRDGPSTLHAPGGQKQTVFAVAALVGDAAGTWHLERFAGGGTSRTAGWAMVVLPFPETMLARDDA